LTRKLPKLLALHEAGRISDAHVRVATDLTYQLDAAVIGKVEARVLERAPEQTVTQFRASLQRVISRLDARRAEERHVEAKADALRDLVLLVTGLSRQARSARSWPTSPPGSTGCWSIQRAGWSPSAASTTIPNAGPVRGAMALGDRAASDLPLPGGNRRAIRCECDHIVPYNGRNTVIANLEPVCLRHHHCKHDAGWHVYRDDNSTTWWTSPTGRRYGKPIDESPAADP
jgi:hypothetical protein